VGRDVLASPLQPFDVALKDSDVPERMPHGGEFLLRHEPMQFARRRDVRIGYFSAYVARWAHGPSTLSEPRREFNHNV
jgi:hypothetical protein